MMRACSSTWPVALVAWPRRRHPLRLAGRQMLGCSDGAPLGSVDGRPLELALCPSDVDLLLLLLRAASSSATTRVGHGEKRALQEVRPREWATRALRPRRAPARRPCLRPLGTKDLKGNWRLGLT